MRKLSKTLLSLLLIAAMLASFVVLPAAAEEPAAEQPTEAVQAAETQSTAAVEGFDLSIVMLDCGRKYFSVDSIKQIIDNASAAGFGYIMLGVGNDGMRFLLDDMSLTVGDKTYSSEDVAAAIHAGNEAYYNFDVDELTQTEMDAVLAYAKEKGMGVIPMLNTPGHMDAILAAATSLTGTNCSYNDSVRTIDVTNSTAVAFTKAFLQKYIDYFAGKGCQYFNMGADEYANDKFTDGSMGFGNLQSAGKYSYYVKYVNAVAALIKNAGMTPMAFNDGIYFNYVTFSGTFDTDIVICYWSNGWTGYTPMPASDLASMGFKMVNTNGSYYWVLGKSDAQCSASKASGFSIKSFPGSTIDNPSGAMFCIWADYPDAETEASVISKTAETIAAFGKKLPDTSAVEKWNPVKENPDTPSDGNTVSAEENENIKITAPGLTRVSAPETDVPANLPGNVSAAKAWNITPYVGEEEYHDAAKVTLPIPAEWAGADVFGGIVNANGEVEIIKDVKLDEAAHTLTFDVEHFSTILAVKVNKTETIEVELGTPKTEERPGNLIGDKTNPLLDNDIATVTGEYKYQKAEAKADRLPSISANDFIIGDGENYLELTGTTISNTTDCEKAAKWQWVESSNGYLLKSVDSDGYYLTLSFNFDWDQFKYVYTLAIDTSRTTRWSYSAQSGFSSSSQYIGISGTSWTAVSSNGTKGHPYKLTTTEAVDKTVLTITGKSAGTTTLMLGNTTYTIVVNYKTQQVNAAVGETTTIAVSGTPDTTGLDTTIAEVTIANNKMTIKGLKAGNTSVRVGDTVYNISVSKVDLTKVNPLTVEYWITNARPTGSDNKQALTIAAASAGVATDDGVDISTLIPEKATKDGRTLYYWRSRLLDPTKTNTSTSGTEKQTEDSGDDDTYSGVGFTRVRFYGTSWQLLTEKNEWQDISVDNYQLVAYYLEYIKVTDEVESFAADWGNKGDNTVGGWLSTSEYCSLSVQVVYEDGITNPTGTTANDLKAKTIVYGYWSDKNGRGIGTVMFEGTEYEIYKVTAETGAVTATISGSGDTGYKANVTNLTWDDNEKTVWEGEPSSTASVHNSANNFSKEGALENLTWDENKEAILLRVYVKAKPKADSLKVRYIDKTTGKQIHEYDINVKANTYFDPGFAKGTGKNTLVNNEVTNYFGITQKVSAELKEMPQISAAYRYSKYTLVEVERKTDGKEVILYYTFNNKHTFVVDFGVPLKIKATDIGVTVPAGDSYWTEATCTGAVYGETKIASGEGLTYTATKPMLGIETLNVTLATGTGEDDKATHTIYLVPATTVYYEQDVATYSNGWELQGTAIAADKYQQTQKGRTPGYNFGYDKYYEENQLGTGGSVKYTSTPGESAQLTFKGTGMELYLRTQNANETSNLNETDATNHSYMLVQVYAGDTADANSLKRMSFVDVNNLFVQSKTGYGYNTPCWTVDDMAYGTYTVVVRYVKGASYGLAIDGFRVTNTLNPDDATTQNFYADVGEAGMQTAEIRNMVLAQAGVPISSLADNWYVVGNKVIDAVFDESDTITGAMILSNDGSGTDTVTVDKELVNIGPKNEIYLQPKQAVVMSFTETFGSVQVGMRSLTGDTVTYKINSEAEKKMKSTVDMYYKVEPVEGKLVIQNVTGGILALTKLKVTGAGTTTNDVSVETTPEAIRYAMALMRGIDVPQFTDVAEDAWYHDYVYDLVYRGVVNGMTATTYEPEGKLTRAQFVKLLACSLADAETLKTYEGRHPFKDSEGHWAEAYIAWAKDKGIVEGVSATAFDPEAPITREQMATIFGRYALKQGIELPKSENAAGSFPDADKISEYAREFVELMRIAGILNGYEDGTFRPQGNATRAEAAKLFSLFLSITDKLAK